MDDTSPIKAGLVAVTFTPGRLTPELSETTPLMVPLSLVTWAFSAMPASTPRSRMVNHVPFFIPPPWFIDGIEWKPRSGCDRGRAAPADEEADVGAGNEKKPPAVGGHVNVNASGAIKIILVIKRVI